MTISGALSNALSGLSAAARGAEVVSANVANAMTEGYGRRELELSSHSLGGTGAGVSVRGTTRSVDQKTISERRLVEASLGQTTARSAFFARLEQAIGVPDDPGSLTARLSQFEAALLEAASRPDSQTRLQAVFAAAQGLTDHINAASDGIQSLRMEADQDINRQVATLNDSLSKIATLDQDIRRHVGAGHDGAALMDQRQQLIDSISAIVPIREVTRANGQIALFTPGGAILMDGKAATISFSPVGVIVPEMTLASGGLSGLSINGQPVSTLANGPLAGGSLAEMFAIRDQHATGAQTRLDAVARDLIERFADPGVDPTLAPTDPGLFTDAGAAFNPTTEIGLSSRLSLNGAADPAGGGALWRLRDGLGAAVPGSIGNAGTLLAMADALAGNRIPASGGFSGAARSAVGLSGDFLSLIHSDLRSAETDQSFSLAKFDTLKTIELRSGVDTDQEMQNLLLVEQAYTANARVISTIDQMIQTILGL